MTERIVGIYIIIFLLNCASKYQGESNKTAEVSLDVLGFVSHSPVIKALELLKIVQDIHDLNNSGKVDYDKKTKQATIYTQLPNGDNVKINTDGNKDLATFYTDKEQINFNPLSFQKKFKLDSTNDVNELDGKIEEDFIDCTNEVLDDNQIDHRNFMSELTARVNCLTKKGYNKNDRAYMQIKHDYTFDSI